MLYGRKSRNLPAKQGKILHILQIVFLWGGSGDGGRGVVGVGGGIIKDQHGQRAKLHVL